MKWASDLLPPARRTAFIEPFPSVGLAMLSRPQSKLELYNDLDCHAFNWWACWREAEDALACCWEDLSRKNGAYHQAVQLKALRRAGNVGEGGPWPEPAAAFQILCELLILREEYLYEPPSLRALEIAVQRHLLPPKLQATAPSKVGDSDSIGWRFDILGDRLRQVQLECRDPLKVLERSAKVEAATIFCEPGPLPAGERHMALQRLLACKGQVALACRPGEWTALGREGWHHTFDAAAQFGLADTYIGGMELWTNFMPRKRVSLFD